MRERFRTYLAENGSSDRGFGLLTTFALLMFGIQRHWLLIPALAIGAFSLIVPRVFRPAKSAWLFLGFLLGMVVNPIVLGALFYLVITPAGLLARALGADPLRRAFDPNSESYWQPRLQPASRFEDQF